MKDELSTEERELLHSWEQGEWQSVADAELLDRYREGIPYQTLMASVLHKYVHGTLAER
ncbi:hypothetical protein [Wenzhouxiangella limi]|uniref:hypothetical protein n=1 Tax=Wenzhouxiangella limi TaxID=2707351 RepID=UPI00194415EF|nr:hypothetical protein [Wenzhouxiangella limi]